MNTTTSSRLGEVFRPKYDLAESDWGRGSGPGSSPYYNLAYRTFLEAFIVQNGVRDIVDIGCGDWQFSRYVRFGDARYLGLDVVDTIVSRNQALFGSETIHFDVMPDDKQHAPEADLLIIKDVLQHLPDSEILDFQHKVFPKYKYCLITNSYRKLDTPSNIDVVAGGFRCLDLKSEPYTFAGAYVLQFTTGVWEEVRTLLSVR